MTAAGETHIAGNTTHTNLTVSGPSVVCSVFVVGYGGIFTTLPGARSSVIYLNSESSVFLVSIHSTIDSDISCNVTNSFCISTSTIISIMTVTKTSSTTVSRFTSSQLAVVTETPNGDGENESAILTVLLSLLFFLFFLLLLSISLNIILLVKRKRYALQK